MPVIGYDPARPYVRSTERTDPLTTEIAEYLAAEADDDMCRLYVIRAEEILAMVRESDRAAAMAEGR
ncbi:hypothetical protein [Devosia lacusdianchii]|uniref:hypothetical protein n=1 Tax=Devosia lacusdianchii TaxID=2917991 RepID=UPI001F06ADD8|nr:hypothetical protein [Devosia sp. JXJ CY 41]